jgi:hypothetical protein
MEELNKEHSAPRKVARLLVGTSKAAGTVTGSEKPVSDTASKKQKKNPPGPASDSKESADIEVQKGQDLLETTRKLSEQVKEMRALIAAAKQEDSDSDPATKTAVHRKRNRTAHTGGHDIPANNTASSPATTEILNFAVLTNTSEPI